MRRYNIIALCLSLVFILSGCNYSYNSEKITTKEESDDIKNEITTVEQGETKIHNEDSYEPEFAIETDDVEFYMGDTEWDSFIKQMEDGKVFADSNSTIKNSIFSHTLEIEGCRTTDVSYFEYNIPREWEFNVYWVQTKTGYEIRHHLFCCDEGVGASAVTYGYTIYDESNNIYVKEINNNKISYVCLMNEKMFMRIVISKDCENYKEITEQLIEYALEIKDLANSEE